MRKFRETSGSRQREEYIDSALVGVEQCAGSGRLPARQLGGLCCARHWRIIEAVVAQLKQKTENDFLWTSSLCLCHTSHVLPHGQPAGRPPAQVSTYR